jgi:hypothetical protein
MGLSILRWGSRLDCLCERHREQAWLLQQQNQKIAAFGSSYKG